MRPPPVRHVLRPQLLSTERDRRHTEVVVICYKRSATVGTCCSQSLSVVLNGNEAGQLLFPV